MLVLSRFAGESIVIGEGADQVVVVVTGFRRGQVQLGFQADRRIRIRRVGLRENPKESLPGIEETPTHA